MGHSVGEYVAACIAGVFSLEDGLKLITKRSRLMQNLPENGEMVAVLATVEKVREVLNNDVVIAAINGPESVVISGKKEGVSKAIASLEASGIKTKKLNVSHAFHSPLMEGMIEEFAQVAQEIKYSDPQINLISNITGKAVKEEITRAEYWCEHIRKSVQFAASIETLHEQGYEIFVEIGATPNLSAMGQNILPSGVGVWLPSLRPEKSDWQQILESLGELYVRGVKINWEAFEQGYSYEKISLPNYPFQRQRYWIERKENLKETAIINLLKQVGENLSEEEEKTLAKIREILVKEKQKPLEKSLSQDLFYKLEWQIKPRQQREKINLSAEGNWLIFADKSGVGEKLAKLLEEQGQKSFLVDHETARKRANSYYVNSEELKKILREVREKSDKELIKVIHLWSLDAPKTDKLTTTELEEAQLLSCGSVLHLVQALVKEKPKKQPSLWLVTQGAVAVEKTVEELAQTPLWGMGKVIGLEHPEIWGGMIDISARSIENEIRELLTEIWDSQGEDHLAFRNGKRYVARLVEQELSAVSERKIKADSTYLITGGLGALGLKVAQWMVEQGAKNLVLIGRSGVAETTQKTLTQMEETGAKVRVVKADVSDEKEMVEVLETIKKSMPPLRGIIHAAGILDDGILLQLDWERFTKVMDPKIKGAWNLHKITKKIPLDFFVLFSSATSLLGSPGQGNYAAANAFLDALAHYRQGLGLKGLSINWGPWKNGGMAARLNNKNKERLASLGIKYLENQQGLQVLEQLIGQINDQIGVISIDWSIYKQQLGSNCPKSLLKELLGKNQNTVSDPQKLEPTIFEDLLKTSQVKRKEKLKSYLQQCMANALHLPKEEVLMVDNFMEQGMDSLMVMEVINQLKKELKLILYPREFYDRPKIDSLVEYLTAEFESAHGLLDEKKSAIKEQVFFVPQLEKNENINRLPGIVFILSSPRSGSTLLRVMLAGHSKLFSPPELHLLPYKNMAERKKNLTISYLGEGLQRAIMEIMGIDTTRSRSLIEEMESQALSISQVYAKLSQAAQTRLLVDKSPTYAMNREVLERAEELFVGAKYIHLVRHPYATIESFVRLRMDKLLESNTNSYGLAEQIWSECNQNILDFAKKIEKERYCQVRYEELVKAPREVLGGVCDFLGINFEEQLLQPYEGKRMTDGVYEKSMAIADPNFLEHNKIDSSLGETWRKINLPHQLGSSARFVATQLGYELPNEVLTPQSQAMRETYLDVRSHPLCLCSWGSEAGNLILCLHGILEQGAAWEEVAVPLADLGYHVVAPDLRGHGRSSHVGIGSPSLIWDLLADVDAIVNHITSKPFTLIGHSFGSIIAAMFASVRSERVSSLVLVESILPSDDNAKGMRAIVEQLETYLDYLAKPPEHTVLDDVAIAASMLRKATPTMSESLALKLAQRITEPCNGGVRWRWNPLLRTRSGLLNGISLSQAKYIELLQQIKAKITLVYGKESNFNKSKDLAKLQTAMKQAEQIIISGGHNLHIDLPSELARIIAEVAGNS